MRPGNMDRRISLFHRALAATDANGSSAQTFPTAYATVWAEKIDAGGREYFAGDQAQAELAVRFKIRYRDDVLATDRITLDGLSHNITHIQELGRREGLMLFATANRNA
jgi:SPP1 family predicted phage head-tail adaptor